MNSRIVVLTCALSAAACGGSETRPAQDPASASTTAAPSDPTVAATTTDSSGHTSANTQGGTTQTTSGTDPSANAATTASNRAADPNASGAAVANNPGVADQTKDADNTKINERDRHAALTPMDQGNSSSETKITAAIRKGIMGDKTLSFTAKNVKIITVGSKVTLRGPVKTDQEKAAIEALAKQTAGVGEVDDQLEVKK